MIHCILGHGASGKTTVQNILQNKFGIPKITTFTTRPKRKNEIDGEHYHFLTNEQFVEKLKKDFFMEYYYILENDWYYGVSLSGVDFKDKDYTLVIEPNGYLMLKQRVGENFIKSHFIHLTEHERLIRMARRKDKVEEIFRRLLSDRKDFEGFDKKANEILYSRNSQKNAYRIFKNIKGERIEKS